jgi:hypothetical protein
VEPAVSAGLLDLRRLRSGLLHPHRPGLELADTAQGRDYASPRKRSLTIDYNQVVGFDFTRNWQVRFVKDFDKTLWLGVSIENPATLTASGNIPANVNGILVNFSNVGGGGGFLTGVAVTTDQAPDIILKAALDPGWGHYEVFGIQRFFTDSTFWSSVLPTGCALNTIDRNGCGRLSAAAGDPQICGRTGEHHVWHRDRRLRSGSIARCDIAADGSLAPITALHVFGGVVVHPREGFDVYAYGGMEEARARFFDQLGYGNPAFDMGFTVTTASSFSSGTTPTCVANNKRLAEVTVGFWQDLYKGYSVESRLAHGTNTSGAKLSRALGARPRPTTMSSIHRYGITRSSRHNLDRCSFRGCARSANA